MPEQLVPDSMAATIADMQRRLQILEATSRVGLNRVRFAWSTHTGTPRVSTMDTWETGPVAATWADDRGNTGTGYPTVTVATGKKFLCFMQALGLDVANDAAFNARAIRIGVGADGLNPRVSPEDGPGGSWTTKPLMSRYDTHGPTTEGTHATTLVVGRSDLTPGTHTFQMWAIWTTGLAGPTNPYLFDAFMAIVPLD